MPLPVLAGAMLTCPMGLAPSVLNVLPLNRTLFESRPVATIQDNIPFVNIPPFGLCTSLANPITAAQTTAALGVLTPGMCTPVLPAPWLPGSPTTLIGQIPALNNSCKCACVYGGMISIVNPASTSVNLG